MLVQDLDSASSFRAKSSKIQRVCKSLFTNFILVSLPNPPTCTWDRFVLKFQYSLCYTCPDHFEHFSVLYHLLESVLLFWFVLSTRLAHLVLPHLPKHPHSCTSNKCLLCVGVSCLLRIYFLAKFKIVLCFHSWTF